MNKYDPFLKLFGVSRILHSFSEGLHTPVLVDFYLNNSFTVSQIPGGRVHFHVCGNPAKDCMVKGEKNVQSGEACLELDKKKYHTALSPKAITYNGHEVRISYDDDIDLLLYCGRDENSNHPQYIGKIRKVRFYITELLPTVQLYTTFILIPTKLILVFYIMNFDV